MDGLIYKSDVIQAVDKHTFDTTEGLCLDNDITCILEEIPAVQQKPLKYTGDSICLYCQTADCDGCMYEPMEGVQ